MLDLDINNLTASPSHRGSAGRKWLEAHRDRIYNSEDVLLDMIAAEEDKKVESSRGEGSRQKVSFAEEESNSSSDEYGSSDDQSIRKSSASGSEESKSRLAKMDDDAGKDEKLQQLIHQLNTTVMDGEDSSEESSDNYGDSDDYIPLKRAVAIEASRNEELSSTSSDDVPLGQRVQDPEGLRKSLQRLDKRGAHRQKKTADIYDKARIVAAEYASSTRQPYNLDANDLIARLLLVQEGREAKQSASKSNTSSLARHNTTTGRNYQPDAHRRPPTIAPPLPQPPPSFPIPIEKKTISNQPTLNSRSRQPHRIQTANLFPITSQKSSPLSPCHAGLPHNQHLGSSLAHSDSTETSMKTAKEYIIPSSSAGLQYEEEEKKQREAADVDMDGIVKPRLVKGRTLPQQHHPPKSADGTRHAPLPNLPAKGNIGEATTTQQMDSKKEQIESVSAPIKQMPSLSLPLASKAQETKSPKLNGNTALTTPVVKHRVYLLNKQRVGIIEVIQNARIRDVVYNLLQKETMPLDSRQGEWTLYDVCPTLAIERPLREYECISDVIAIRSNANEDYFCIKRTELSPYLSIKNTPNSSASLAGWLHIRDNHRNNKWNKRWLELRENCLYVAKSEKGKEEVLLCSLSSFDLYICDSDRIKTPKLHAFAMRSQNGIEMFESPEADYVHYLCLSDGAAARHWITAIINSRTFVLKQEKSHLFRMQPLSTILPTLDKETSPIKGTGVSNGRQSSELDVPRNVSRTARVPLRATSPSLNAPANILSASSTPHGPLLTFQQPSYPKGSLMEERYNQDIQLTCGLVPQSILIQQRQTANDQKRREEVQKAERKGRKEGKPLIGIIS